MNRMLPLLLFTAVMGCAEKPHPEAEPEVIHSAVKTPAVNSIRFPQVDDNIAHDTLLIQTTFDLGDGTFIMIASHIGDEERQSAGERTDGLRLYHYRPARNEPAEILAVSSPAHDSWTLFPTFFNDPFHEGSLILLANMGERNSWGQKVLRLDVHGFHDLGFMDVAAVEQVLDDDEVTTKLLNIAPQTLMLPDGNALNFQFLVEEIMLYDDLRGGLEQTLSGDRITYRWNTTDGMILHIDGEARLEHQPS